MNKIFRCDCHDRNHYIDLYADLTDKYPEIYLSFVSSLVNSDYDNNVFINIFYEFRWRIKIALKILFNGIVQVEDSWIPARVDEETLIGVKELEELTNHLLFCVNALKNRTDNT